MQGSFLRKRLKNKDIILVRQEVTVPTIEVYCMYKIKSGYIGGRTPKYIGGFSNYNRMLKAFNEME